MTSAHLHSLVLGVNHRTCPVELREKLQIGKDSLADFVNKITMHPDKTEIVILSTCNRTELYAATENPDELLPKLYSVWTEHCNVSQDELKKHAYQYFHGEAIRHLLRVVCSLDSLVLGEAQIFGQVKEAYAQCRDLGCLGFYMNHLFQSAMTAGKRVRSETSINQGAVSISYAAVELAKKVMGDLSDKSVALIGTGEMGELAAQHLKKAGVKQFVIFNRSPAGAEKLAAAYDGQFFLLDDLEEKLDQCDIVISATGSPLIVVNKKQIQAVMRKRQGTALFLIDIALPRDIEASVNEINNVFLFTIDDLKDVVDQNFNARRSAAENAQIIIESEAKHIESWYYSLNVVPIVKLMREKYQQIAENELEKHLNINGTLSDTEIEALKKFSHSLMNKFLHDPSTQLKKMAEMGEGDLAGHFARTLFMLDLKDSDEQRQT